MELHKMSSFHLLLSLIFVLNASSLKILNHKIPSLILESPNVTDRGDWGELITCSNTPENVVVGFQLRVDYRDPFNEDNTALNGIWLACGNPLQRNQSEENLLRKTEWISSSNGSYGQFQQRLFCSSDGGYAVGFQLKSQQDQGPLVDDVGAVNFKLICADGEEIEGYDEKEDLYPDAEYTDTVLCPKEMAVCGIQTQVEDIKWTGDNTALNNVRIQCCELPKQEPVSTTTENKVDEAAVTINSGQEEGPLPQLVRLFETQAGIGLNETIAITSGQCNPLPENWIGRVGSLEYKADCIRIWETTSCSGHTRCHCDEGFISLSDSHPMSKNASSWNGRVKGLSMCMVENDNFTSFRMFSDRNFQGDSEYRVLVPEECLTFYEGDKWRGNVRSMVVVDGCVEYFDEEECCGNALNTTLAHDYAGSPEIKNWEIVRSLKNCAKTSTVNDISTTKY